MVWASKMKRIKQVLFIPFITPLALIIIISCLNLNQTTRIRILTWRSPQASIGLLMIIASTSGALVSFFNSRFIHINRQPLRRKVLTNLDRKNINNSINSFNEINISNSKSDVPESSLDINEEIYVRERNPRDPLPTVSVPFTVIKRTSNQHDSKRLELYEDDIYPQPTFQKDLIDTDNSYDNEDWGKELIDNW